MKINLSSIWIALGLIGSLSFASEVLSESQILTISKLTTDFSVSCELGDAYKTFLIKALRACSHDR